MNMGLNVAEPGWPARIWTLAGLGALAALAIQQLADLPESDWAWGPRLVGALMLLIGIGALAFALSWQRGRHVPAMLLALACGAVAGGVLIWNGLPGRGEFMSWRLLCGLAGAGFILTLFQAAQARHPHLPARWTLQGLRAWKREALVYTEAHEAIWTDAILLGAAGLFTGIVMLIAHLLAAMFALVEIDLLRELLGKGWANALVLGAAAGGAIGLLRERAAIIAALQRVAMMVLRVLAPVLAVGLVSFLAVLPFTGLAPLWATGNTTALMLGAALAALFLVNAVVGDGAGERALARPLRWGAQALGLALLPLVLISAWSTGLRIGQHGLSPDRLWALTFIVLGTITAIAYAVAILRRGDWTARLLRSNLHLAFILGGVSILLSTSLVSFERIATADQVARLESGRVEPVDFDYRGLWFGFGPPGKAAIERLARDARDADVRRYAEAVRKMEFAFAEAPNERVRRSGDALDKRLTILPGKVALEPRLRERLTEYDACQPSGPCELRYVAGDDHAIVIRPADRGCEGCVPSVTLLVRGPRGDWGSHADVLEATVAGTQPASTRRADQTRIVAAVRAGKVEVRTVQRRQVYVDGRPFGDPMPPENAAEP